MGPWAALGRSHRLLGNSDTDDLFHLVYLLRYNVGESYGATLSANEIHLVAWLKRQTPSSFCCRPMCIHRRGRIET